MTKTQEIITHAGFQKFMNGYEGMCMSEGKFLKEWQVRDRIIGWIIFQITFNLLQMTQTQEIKPHRVLQNLMNGYEGMCIEWGKFLKEWQVTDKILGVGFFPMSYSRVGYTWLRTQEMGQL